METAGVCDGHHLVERITWRLSPLLIVLLLWPPSVTFGAECDSARGRRLASTGQTDEALRIFVLCKQASPEAPGAFLDSAKALLGAGRIRDAQLELDEAALREPRVEAQVLAYARARTESGQLNEAVRALTKVARSPALDPAGLWLLADLHYRLKQPKEARQALDLFAAQRPRDPRLNLRRGQVYIYLEEYENALTALEEAVWADPEASEAHFEMARTLRYGNNLPAARKAAARAVELDPDNAEYLHMLGVVCAGLNQGEDAVFYLTKASKAPGTFTRVLFDLGNALRRTGDRAGSREVLTRYRTLFTREEDEANLRKTVDALANQGQLQIQQRKVAEARESFLRIVTLDPENWTAHSFLAKIYLSSGRPALAREHLKALEKIDAQSSEGNYLLAFAAYQQRSYQNALKFAEESKRLRPGDPELRNLLGNIYVSLGRRREALGEYAAALKLAPDRLDIKANFETLARKLNP